MSLKDIPRHLRINGRDIDNTFTDECLLYRGFTEEDIDEINDLIKTEHVRCPDYSCNWNRYAYPEDVRYRKEGCSKEGCYSITAKDAKYRNFARPVHDPIEEEDYENYSHTDVRIVRPLDSEDTPPPANRNQPKSKTYRNDKLAYRQNLVNNLIIIFPPE